MIRGGLARRKGGREGGREGQQTQATYRLCELDAIHGEFFALEGLKFDQHHGVRRCGGWEGMSLRGSSRLRFEEIRGEQTLPTEQRHRSHGRVLVKFRHKVGVRAKHGCRGCGDAWDSRTG